MADIASAIIAGASLAATSETQISGAINTNRNATVEIGIKDLIICTCLINRAKMY